MSHEHHGISDHTWFDCLFKLTAKKLLKLHITDTLRGEFKWLVDSPHSNSESDFLIPTDAWLSCHDDIHKTSMMWKTLIIVLCNETYFIFLSCKEEPITAAAKCHKHNCNTSWLNSYYIKIQKHLIEVVKIWWQFQLYVVSDDELPLKQMTSHHHWFIQCIFIFLSLM